MDGNEPNATSCSKPRHLSTEAESTVTEGERRLHPSSAHPARGRCCIFFPTNPGNFHTLTQI